MVVNGLLAFDVGAHAVDPHAFARHGQQLGLDGDRREPSAPGTRERLARSPGDSAG